MHPLQLASSTCGDHIHSHTINARHATHFSSSAPPRSLLHHAQLIDKDSDPVRAKVHGDHGVFWDNKDISTQVGSGRFNEFHALGSCLANAGGPRSFCHDGLSTNLRLRDDDWWRDSCGCRCSFVGCLCVCVCVQQRSKVRNTND